MTTRRPISIGVLLSDHGTYRNGNNSAGNAFGFFEKNGCGCVRAVRPHRHVRLQRGGAARGATGEEGGKRGGGWRDKLKVKQLL